MISYPVAIMRLHEIAFRALLSYSQRGNSKEIQRSREVATTLKMRAYVEDPTILMSEWVAQTMKRNRTNLPFAATGSVGIYGESSANNSHDKIIAEDHPPIEDESVPTMPDVKEKKTYRGIYAIGLLLLTLLGFPLIAIYAKYSSLAANETIADWNNFAFVLLTILAVFSMYVMVKEQSEKHQETGSQVLADSFRLLFKYKHMTLPVLVLSLFSVLEWISGYSVFGIELIYSIVIILGLETIFHLAFNSWPKKLKTSPRLQTAFIIFLIFGGFFLSFGFLQTLVVFVVALIFFGIIFVGGIGIVAIVDALGSVTSQQFKPRRRLHYVYLFGLVALSLILMQLASNYFFSLKTSDSVISEELYALQSGANLSLIFTQLALVLGIAYLAYSFLRKRVLQNATKSFYLVIVISVAGFFLSYMYGLLQTDYSAAVNPANSLVYSILEILPSMGLFAVGYGQLLIETPRKIAARMGLQQDKFLASLTLFILSPGA
ncbi:MAG: hypothetical protein M1368_04330, partial [Thaumarchaeota archaeon]|nr:hypothetical protein [Nitrososphaerota archaeon]